MKGCHKEEKQEEVTVIAVFQASVKKVVGIVDMCCMRYAERTNVESV